VDRFIASFPAVADGDLMLCEQNGVAWQADMSARVDYGPEYWEKCAGYEGSEIAEAINAARVGLVGRYFGGRVCDIGIGSGAFVRARPSTYGFDVNPAAIAWLKREGLFVTPRDGFGAFTFWDVLEHVETPAEYLELVPLHGWVFVSLPIFRDLRAIRESRHYRPGEHLYYWTDAGFIAWMGLHWFWPHEANDDETRAGRESIRSYAFRRNRITAVLKDGDG